jgi:hydrogenase/urease accessory protein HupE
MIKRFVVFAIWTISITPSLVLAHSPIEGVNNFYNGVLHPLFVPAHLLLLLALGIFFAQQGVERYRAALRLFLVASLVGLAAAWFVSDVSVEFYLLCGSAILGMLIAANKSIDNYIVLFGVSFAGFCLGIDSAQEALSGVDRMVSLLGSGVGVLLLLGLSLLLVDNLKKKDWQKIGLRVVGSWIAASAFLVLALSLSTGVYIY